MAEPHEEYINSINNRIATFERQYRQISRSAEIFSRYNTWVHFECNKLIIDTANPINKNIILQTWEYDKNGSGKANSFTLRICYDFSNSAELYKHDDIHYVEQSLCLNEIMTDSNGLISGYKNNVSKLRCKFRYGYLDVGTDGSRVLSPNYEGMVTSVVPELRDNMLFYTIKGTSGAFGGNNIKKFSFPRVEGKKATDLAFDVLNSYYGENYKDEKDKSDGIGFMYTLTEPYEIINKTKAYGAIYSKEKPQTFKENTSSTVFDYVNNVLKEADLSDIISQTDLDNIPSDKRPYYTFYIDECVETGSRKRIVIDIVDPSNILASQVAKHIENGEEDWKDYQVPSEISSSYDADVVFEYPNKNQNFILSFLPSVDLITIMAGVVVGDNNATRWGIDDGGILLSTESIDGEGYSTVSQIIENESDKQVATSSQLNTERMGELMSGDDKSKESKVRTKEGESSFSSFSKATDISYKATLSCLGIPCDIPIGTRIQIRPILNGSKYMFSGSYYVLNCSDRIDSSGYITEMNLFRLSDGRKL